MTPDDERHGTYAGYQMKCRCQRCRTANADYLREFRANRPRLYERDKERTAARRRALTRLARLHPEEYELLYLEEIGPAQRVVSR